MLIQLHGDVLSFNLGAVQSLFGASRVFLSPEFYHAGVFTESGLRVGRSERAKRTEEIVELRIVVSWRKVLYEARRRARRWKGRVRGGRGIGREYEKDRRM